MKEENSYSYHIPSKKIKIKSKEKRKQMHIS